MKLDITTTATIRPGIVERTLWSFKRLAFRDHDVRLILNIDPVGEEQFTQQHVLNIAKKYYSNIVVRMPDVAHYVKAIKWTWSQVETDLFFFLEDDYHLYCPLDVDAMARAFQHEERLAVLRLPKGDTTETECHWARHGGGFTAQWNGYYYKGKHIQFTGMPSLIRTEWMRDFLATLTNDKSIEIQARLLRKHKNPIVRNWKYGVFAEPNTPLTVEDIGEIWKRKLKIRKNGGPKELKIGFTGWLRKGRPYSKFRNLEKCES